MWQTAFKFYFHSNLRRYTPALLASLTDRQRAVLQPPFVYERHNWDEQLRAP
jgi:hypothetical protein